MIEQPTVRLSGEEVLALRFAAHRQLTRWAQKDRLSPRQHAKHAALARAVRILGNRGFGGGCELHVPSKEQ